MAVSLITGRFRTVFMRRMVLLLILGICMHMEVMGKTGNASVSSSRPSAVNIGALFTFDSAIGRAARAAIETAVDDVNSDSSILPGTRLNLISLDTNCSEFLGTMEGISMKPKILILDLQLPFS